MEKIKVNYTMKGDLDFGLFPDKYAQGNIKVRKDFWIKYINKRMEFEQMHQELFFKIAFNKRENIHKILKETYPEPKEDEDE